MTPSPLQQSRTVAPSPDRGVGDAEPRRERLVGLLLVGCLSVLGGLTALLVALLTVMGTT